MGELQAGARTSGLHPLAPVGRPVLGRGGRRVRVRGTALRRSMGSVHGWAVAGDAPRGLRQAARPAAGPRWGPAEAARPQGWRLDRVARGSSGARVSDPSRRGPVHQHEPRRASPAFGQTEPVASEWAAGARIAQAGLIAFRALAVFPSHRLHGSKIWIPVLLPTRSGLRLGRGRPAGRGEGNQTPHGIRRRRP